MSETLDDFVSQFHAAMARDEARPRLAAFIKGLSQPKVDLCIGAYFKASTDPQHHYSRTDKRSLGIFFDLAWAAVDRGEKLYAVRFDALVHADKSPWQERFSTLGPGQQGKLAKLVEQKQKALSQPQQKLLRMIPKAIQSGATGKIQELVEHKTMSFQDVHDCLLAYLEASLRYRADNERSLLIFYGVADVTIRKGNADFVKDFRRLVASAGNTWSLRWNALTQWHRDDLEKSLKSTILKSEVRELTKSGTGPVSVVTPTPAVLRDDVTRRDVAKRSEVYRDFEQRFEKYMAPGGDLKVKKAEISKFIFKQDLRGARECFAAYVDLSPKYSKDSEPSLYVFWGLASWLIHRGSVYEALKLELHRTTPRTVVAERFAALPDYPEQYKTKLQSEINELTVKRKRRILDDLKLEYFKKHRADPDLSALRGFEPAVDADLRDQVRSAAYACDRTFRMREAKRFASAFDAWAALMHAGDLTDPAAPRSGPANAFTSIKKREPLVHVTMLKWCRELRDITPLLRSELYWYGVLALQIASLARYPEGYDKGGLSQEEKDFFFEPSLVPQAYRSDFERRVEYVFWKRASPTQLLEVSRAHALLLFVAQKMGLSLLSMQETKDVYDQMVAFRNDKTRKAEDLRIPISSRFAKTLTVGETVGNLWIVWFERKKFRVYVEVEGCGRVIFSIDSDLTLGRLKSEDATYGQVWRDTQHLLTVIAGFYQLMGYLPDLVSGGLAGLAVSLATNMAVDAFAETANLGSGATTALSLGANFLSGHWLDRFRAERATQVHLDVTDLDDIAAGAGRGALWRVDVPATPHVSGAPHVATDLPLATPPVSGGPHAPDSPVAPLAPGSTHPAAVQPVTPPGAPRATPPPDAPPVARPVQPRSVSPAQRGTAPTQKLLPPPKYTAAELHTAKVVGLEPDQVRAIASVLGKDFDTTPMRDFFAIWQRVRAQHRDAIGGVEQMFAQRVPLQEIAERARVVFGDIRDDFWRAVRNGTDATSIGARSKLAEAGIQFLGDATAPFVTMKTSQGWANVQVQVDHIAELGTQPMRAFSPRNFRLSLRDENTILLNQIHMQDPFQADVRRTVGRGTSRAGKLLDDSGYRGRTPKAGRLPDPNQPRPDFDADVDAGLEGQLDRLNKLPAGQDSF